MTAGHGVSHAEEPTGGTREDCTACSCGWPNPRPPDTRPRPSSTTLDLPELEQGPARATVLVGQLGGVVSPARQETPLVGADVRLGPGRVDLPVEAAFEHALVVLEGAVRVDGRTVAPGPLAYLGPRTGCTGIGGHRPDTPPAGRRGTLRVGDHHVVELRGPVERRSRRGGAPVERRIGPVRRDRVDPEPDSGPSGPLVGSWCGQRHGQGKLGG